MTSRWWPETIEVQHKDFRFGNSPISCAVDGNRLNTARLTSPPAPLLRGEGSQVPPFPGREGGLGGLGQSYPSSIGNRLYVTQAQTITVAVLDKDQKVMAQPTVHLQGLVPTRWYPTKIFANEGQPLVLSANKVFSCDS